MRRYAPLLLLLLLVPLAHAALPATAPPIPDVRTIPLPPAGDNAGVVIIYPLAVDVPELNVTFKHNFTSAATCRVYDNITSGALRTRQDVPDDFSQAVSFSAPYDPGDYLFTVECANSTYTTRASRAVRVSVPSDNPAGVAVSPSGVYPGQEITITGRTLAHSNTTIQVIDPDEYVDELYVLATTSSFRITYTVPLDAMIGNYTVVVFSQDDTENISQSKFTVKQRVPYMEVAGNPSTIRAGYAVYIFGEQFLPSDNVTLALTGGGLLLTNKTRTDVDGIFTFGYPDGFRAGTYALVAKSTTDSDITARMNFTVVESSSSSSRSSSSSLSSGSSSSGSYSSSDDWSDSSGGSSSDDWSRSSSDSSDDGGSSSYDDGSSSSGSSQDPIIEDPAPVSSFRWLYFLIGFVVIVGGLFGYLVYNGSIDLSSGEAFSESIRRIFSADAPSSGGAARIDPGEEQTIRSFIYGERHKGFDDLTIRSALVAKGWDKYEVDRIFDEIYQNR
jgi:hypothetical protein